MVENAALNRLNLFMERNSMQRKWISTLAVAAALTAVFMPGARPPAWTMPILLDPVPGVIRVGSDRCLKIDTISANDPPRLSSTSS